MNGKRTRVVRGGAVAVALGVGLGLAAVANGQAPAPDAKAGVRPQDPEAVNARLTVLRRKVLRDEDFIENGDTNRDPFRSYLRLFVDPGRVVKAQQVPSVFDKFALEELALIAIVSGDANPRAMFRDPGGLGQVVKRGDYVSKAAARVTKILSDRVVLELTELLPTGESRPIEKAILVNPEAAQK